MTSPIFGPGFAALTEREQLTRAAQELEAVVVSQLLGAMRKTVPESGLFESSASSEIFRSLFDAELAREMAKKSPFGLAEAVVTDLENRVKADETGAELAVRASLERGRAKGP